MIGIYSETAIIEKQYGDFSKNSKRAAMDSALSLLSMCLRRKFTEHLREMFVLHDHCRISHSSQGMEKKGPCTDEKRGDGSVSKLLVLKA